MINTLLNIIPMIATVFLVICYFPQLHKTWKTKNVEDISFSFFLMLNVALTLLLINSILLYTQKGNFGYGDWLATDACHPTPKSTQIMAQKIFHDLIGE